MHARTMHGARTMARAAMRRALPPPPPSVVALAFAHPAPLALAVRCFASSAAKPPSQGQQQEQREAQEEEDDGGADFVTGEPSYSRGQPQQQSLSEASGSFQRSAGGGGGGGGHSILPPRKRSNQAGTAAGSGRADDPATRNLIARMNTFNITSSVDTSVPVGTVGARAAAAAGELIEGDRIAATPGSRALPRKGGRPIQSADAIEQRGKLTPMQLHRVLSSLQQQPTNSPDWTVSSVAEAYNLSPAAVSSLRATLALPFVSPSPGREAGFWEGGTEEPIPVQIQRSLGQPVERTRILGEHLRIDRGRT